MPSPRPSPGDDRPHSRLRPWLLAGASLAVVAVVVGGGLYALRGQIGTRLAVDYLKKRGVPAQIEIERLDLGGFTGRVRLGPADDPDLVVDRVEATFEPIPILQSGLAAPRLRNLELVHPRLKATFDGRRMSFGSLQPLIDEALKAAPSGAPGPDVEVEHGELRLSTYAGPILATGNAELVRGRLRRANGRIAAAVLKPGPGVVVRLQSAQATVLTQEDRFNADVKLALAGLDGPVTAGASTVVATVSLPYGANGFTRLDGPVAGELHLQADRLAGGGLAGRGVDLTARLTGAARGPTSALALDLSTQLGGSAARLDAAGVGAERVKASGVVQGLHWAPDDLAARRASFKAAAQAASGLSRPTADLVLSELRAARSARGWTGGAGVVLDAAAARFDQPTPAGRLTLAALSLKGRGRADLHAGAPPSLSLAGGLASGRGGLDAASAARLSQALAGLADENRVAAALRAFTLAAPAWRLASAGGATDLRLDKPVRLAAAAGPALVLSPAGGAAAHVTHDGAAGGAFTLALSGRGVPGLDLAVPRYRIADGRGEAAVRLDARFDGALLHQGTLKGSGGLAFDRSGARFSPDGCLDARLQRLGAGRPAFAEALSAGLCSDGAAPLTAVGAGGWRVQARLEDASARLPIAEASVDSGAGRVILAGQGGGAAGRVEVARLHAVDAAKSRRFNPLVLSGAVDLRDGEWRGPVEVRDAAKGRALATVTLRQAAAGATGSARIDAPSLVFSPGGLQPTDLSPLGGLVTRVDATTRFTGEVRWSNGAVTSDGRFSTDGAAFDSPLGRVTGAHADVTFDSLLPPTAAPGQSFSAANVAWIAPLTDVGAHFALTTAATRLSEAHATVAHGTTSLGPLDIPFADDRTVAGTLTLKNIDLGELVAGSSLADSVSIQARVDGTVPFSAGPMGVTFKDGVIVATGPGRLSIKRQALTGAVATAGAAGAQPNAIQDFAYQALENLAFDSLEAKIASRPMGRLGAIFTIKGRNDPPKPTRSRIGILDLLRGHAFDKPIDLPKGTPVDLTLDTSLNFDELLKAYAAIGRNSAPVQP